MANASSILLLLLLVAAPFSSVASRPSTIIGKFAGKFFNAKAVRSIGWEMTMGYLQDNEKEGIQDLAGQSNKDGRQLGSSAASSYSALVFDLSVGSGTSAQNLSVVMDITSELIWAQCDPCTTCVRQTPADTPTFFSELSYSFDKISCNENTCRDFILGPGDICGSTEDLCGYTERFIGSGSTSGYLAKETFSFETTDFPGMLFGCGSDIKLPGLAGASGFAGFSRSPLSLVSQLDISRFSYFIDNSENGGSLSWSIGQAADTTLAKGSHSTPLLVPTPKQNPYWYYVKLTGVEVNGKLLTDIPAGTFDVSADGSGGVFLSTTLPVTYLQQAAYNVLRRELISLIKASHLVSKFSPDDLTRLCFLTKDFDKAKIPTLSLVFDGSDAPMELSVKNYFFKLAGGTTCLTIQPSIGGSVLGSLLQAGRTMTYDIYAGGGGQLTFEMVASGAPAQVHVPLITILATLLVAWGLSI